MNELPGSREPIIDKPKLTELFNLGFRRGANDRAALGLSLGQPAEFPGRMPSSGSACLSPMERQAWEAGYRRGYRVGASDTELASVEVPGAHGMISGFSEEFLNLIGFFRVGGEYLKSP